MATFRVLVLNDKRTVNALRKAALKVSDLKDAWQRIGHAIKRDALTITPVLTGRLAESLRVGKAKRQAVVRAGNARLVYAPIQHYGGYNNIEAKPFLTTALYANEDTANQEIERELDRIIRRAGLS